MKKTKNWRLVGMVNGATIVKEYVNEYEATTCAKTLNEVFAPFVVEEINVKEEIVPTPVTTSDGNPF
jgi:hypothetical protein